MTLQPHNRGLWYELHGPKALPVAARVSSAVTCNWMDDGNVWLMDGRHITMTAAADSLRGKANKSVRAVTCYGGGALGRQQKVRIRGRTAEPDIPEERPRHMQAIWRRMPSGHGVWRHLRHPSRRRLPTRRGKVEHVVQLLHGTLKSGLHVPRCSPSSHLNQQSLLIHIVRARSVLKRATGASCIRLVTLGQLFPRHSVPAPRIT